MLVMLNDREAVNTNEVVHIEATHKRVLTITLRSGKSLTVKSRESETSSQLLLRVVMASELLLRTDKIVEGDPAPPQERSET